jgi:membrane-bound lytic murein transglycosylase D
LDWRKVLRVWGGVTFFATLWAIPVTFASDKGAVSLPANESLDGWAPVSGALSESKVVQSPGPALETRDVPSYPGWISPDGPVFVPFPPSFIFTASGARSIQVPLRPPTAATSRVPLRPPAVLFASSEGEPADRVLPPADVEDEVAKNRDEGVHEEAEENPLAGLLGESEIPQGEDGVPPGLAGRVRMFINYFQTRGRDRFALWLARSGKYSTMMQDILAEYGLPGDLVYLALIESGFSPRAYSVAHAAGPWQFISGTARRYGLHIDWWTDERRDFEKSTHAAASYLRDLYGMFESWDLAAAAYNAGEGKIMRGLSRYKSDGYAELIRHRYLAQETKDYVPKMYAALSIAKEPVKYGFDNVQYEDPLVFDRVEVPGGTDLYALGEIIGVPHEMLRELNPEIRRFCTPPSRETYAMRVPLGYGDIVRERMEDVRGNAKVTFLQHTVRKGETLGTLAGKYGTTVPILREINGLGENSIPQRASLIIPVTGLSPEDAVPGKEISIAQIEKTVARMDHHLWDARRIRVRPGDTLSQISRRTGVSVRALMRANNLKSAHHLRAGTIIRIPRGGAAPKPEVRQVSHRPGSPGKGEVRHVVRRGENLTGIARRYGVTVGQIAERNNLKIDQVLHQGRVLVIPTEVRHVVRSGENLTGIARRYGVTVGQIAERNNLKIDQVLLQGRVLVIPAGS